MGTPFWSYSARITGKQWVPWRIAAGDVRPMISPGITETSRSSGERSGVNRSSSHHEPGAAGRSRRSPDLSAGVGWRGRVARRVPAAGPGRARGTCRCGLDGHRDGARASSASPGGWAGMAARGARPPGSEPTGARAAVHCRPSRRASPGGVPPLRPLRRARDASARLQVCRSTLGQAFDDVDTGMAIYRSDDQREIARNARWTAILVAEPERDRLVELIGRRVRQAAAAAGRRE